MRIDSLRDGFILCYVHKEWAPPQCSQKKLGNVVMAKAADVYQNRWAQVKHYSGQVIYWVNGILF